jgi:hypothetical protein
MNGKVGLRILSALVLVAAIAGIAFFAFQAGVAKGSPVTIEAPAGQTAPVAPYPYGYGYGMRFYHPFGFGFGCFGILIPLFLFFLAAKAFRMLFWGSRWGYMGPHHGPWRRDWGERGVPPMFDEWHKKAHHGPGEGGEPTEDKKE